MRILLGMVLDRAGRRLFGAFGKWLAVVGVVEVAGWKVEKVECRLLLYQSHSKFARGHQIRKVGSVWVGRPLAGREVRGERESEWRTYRQVLRHQALTSVPRFSTITPHEMLTFFSEGGRNEMEDGIVDKYVIIWLDFNLFSLKRTWLWTRIPPRKHFFR